MRPLALPLFALAIGWIAAFALLFAACTPAQRAGIRAGGDVFDALCPIGEALLLRDDPEFGTLCASGAILRDATLEIVELWSQSPPPEGISPEGHWRAVCACVARRKAEAP